jgi:hypothetical protein
MNTEQVFAIASGESLSLPEPDPENITVLTHNLPNKPILPWNHYDSPWQDTQAENDEDQKKDSIDSSETAADASRSNEQDSNQATTNAEQSEAMPTDALQLEESEIKSQESAI